MSEALDKVRGVHELPIFPLPVVLFPGMPMPLHIFEERYRKMVANMFMRVANSIRVINDERGSLPDISDTDPQKLSFLVAAAMEIEPETKQELLELRSTSERLHRLRDLLARVVHSFEERARLHSLAKGNGHAGKKIDLE